MTYLAAPNGFALAAGVAFILGDDSGEATLDPVVERGSNSNRFLLPCGVGG